MGLLKKLLAGAAAPPSPIGLLLHKVSNTHGHLSCLKAYDAYALDLILAPYGPQLPEEYIKTIPHPHSLDSIPVIVPLNSPSSPKIMRGKTEVHDGISAERPWAPFLTLADFEYTETAVNGLLSKKIVDRQLAGFNSRWAVGSLLSIQNSKDMEAALAMACDYIVKVSASH